MPVSVEVITGSRLHFGPLAQGSTDGRAFGGIGLMVAQPRLRVAACPSSVDCYAGPPQLAGRAQTVLSELRQRATIGPVNGVALRVHMEGALHQGLGGGTQLALAIAQAVLGPQRIAAARLAQLTGRGLRSAIGLHGFECGGFLVDAGKQAGEPLGTLAVREPFPPDWRIALWTRKNLDGLSGSMERAALEQLAPMPPELTHRLCSVVLRDLLPALRSRDFQGFSRGLRQYGDLVGEYFSPVQGGRAYADPQAGQVLDWLADRGLEGAAQSSWGPTLAVMLPDERTAVSLEQEWPFTGGTLRVTSAQNEPAMIRELASDASRNLIEKSEQESTINAIQ